MDDILRMNHFRGNMFTGMFREISVDPMLSAEIAKTDLRHLHALKTMDAKNIHERIDEDCDKMLEAMRTVLQASKLGDADRFKPAEVQIAAATQQISTGA